MDPLRRDSVADARQTPPGRKLEQALVLMRDGIALQRAKFRAKHPQHTDEEIETLMWAWLARE